MSIKYDKILGKMREADSGSGPAPEPYVLPVATDSTLGGVKIGSGVDVATDGTMSLALPVAAADVLGAIKVGTGLSIDSATGVLSASGGSSFTPVTYNISSSKTWAVPADGLYLIIAVGGNGGGAAGNVIGSTACTGGGGGGGGAFILLTEMKFGGSLVITIGAGGKGGQSSGNSSFAGTDGGDTIIKSISNAIPSNNNTEIHAAGGGRGGFGATANDFNNRAGGNRGGIANIPSDWGSGSGSITLYRGFGTYGCPGIISDELNTGSSLLFGGAGGRSLYAYGGNGGYTTTTGWTAGQDGTGGIVTITRLS